MSLSDHMNTDNTPLTHYLLNLLIDFTSFEYGSFHCQYEEYQNETKSILPGQTKYRCLGWPGSFINYLQNVFMASSSERVNILRLTIF